MSRRILHSREGKSGSSFLRKHSLHSDSSGNGEHIVRPTSTSERAFSPSARDLEDIQSDSSMTDHSADQVRSAPMMDLADDPAAAVVNPLSSLSAEDVALALDEKPDESADKAALIGATHTSTAQTIARVETDQTDASDLGVSDELIRTTSASTDNFDGASAVEHIHVASFGTTPDTVISAVSGTTSVSSTAVSSPGGVPIVSSSAAQTGVTTAVSTTSPSSRKGSAVMLQSDESEEKYPNLSEYGPVLKATPTVTQTSSLPMVATNLGSGVSTASIASVPPTSTSIGSTTATATTSIGRSTVKKEKKLRITTVFKKEKKKATEELSDTSVEDLVRKLKEHLQSMHNDYAVSHMLDHVKTSLTRDQRQHFYSLLWNDVDFIRLTCERLLEIDGLKQNEVICEWLFNLFSDASLSVAVNELSVSSKITIGSKLSKTAGDALLFAVSLIPCLIWCLLSKEPSVVSGIAGALLALYKTQRSLMIETSAAVLSDPSAVALELFAGYRAPSLSEPSIFHSPKRAASHASSARTKTSRSSSGATMTTSSLGLTSGDSNSMMEGDITMARMKDVSSMMVGGGKLKESGLSQRDKTTSQTSWYFPTLTHATLSTNLHLIQVALELFHRMAVLLPSLCLEHYCAVAAQLCRSGLGSVNDGMSVTGTPSHHASMDQQSGLPELIEKQLGWKWKWRAMSITDDIPIARRFILPSNILNQFLATLRIALHCDADSTRRVAQYALAQIHRRGNLDMIPEIMLQTNAMLDDSVFDFS